MGNAAEKSLTESRQRVESKVGKVQLSGRYHRLPNKIDDDYEVSQKVLGSGYNGVVRMGTNKHNKSQKVAIKAFKVTGLQPDKRAQLEAEVEIFLCMDHPHVTRLFDVYESHEVLNLVMECMEGGELFDRVTFLKQFSEKDAADCVWQMLLAVNYIHSQGIVHRDLKLENFLYDRKEGNHLKLIDFGFSKVLADPNIKMRVSCGTLSYVAPEVLERSYTSQCDLWSLGVIVFICLAGYMPFSGSEAIQTKNIQEGKYRWKPERWKNVSELGQEFVRALLQVDPKKRLNAQQALDHQWIANREKIQKKEVDPLVVDALRQFGQATKFRRCCMEMMAWSLSNEERSKVREYFIMMDKSQKGTITLSELKQVMVDKFNIPDQETQQIFNALDSNNDEEIHYSDFLAAMVQTRIAVHDDLLKMAFKKFDTDNSGYITVQNMREVLGETHDGEQIEDLMREADFSKDGRISYAEFVSYIRGTPLEKHELGAVKLVDNEMKKGGAREYTRGHKAPMTLKPASQRRSQREDQNSTGQGGQQSAKPKGQNNPCCTAM